jgi:hypothetical protein
MIVTVRRSPSFAFGDGSRIIGAAALVVRTATTERHYQVRIHGTGVEPKVGFWRDSAAALITRPPSANRGRLLTKLHPLLNRP